MAVPNSLHRGLRIVESSMFSNIWCSERRFCEKSVLLNLLKFAYIYNDIFSLSVATSVLILPDKE